MKEILEYIPGFRSNTKWKKVMASIYYAFCVIGLASSLGTFLMYISIPFIVFGVVNVIKYKNKTVMLTLIGAVLIFVVGVNINPEMKSKTITSTTTSKPEITIKEVTAPVVKQKTPEELKIEADVKAKADAAAKVIAIQKAKEDAAAKIIADKKAIADKKVADALAAKAKYKTWVDSQFSPWDGSHTYLVDLVKKNLNDDKSFKHVETTYSDKGTYLILKMTYRATNGFGAVILQNVTAKADYKTNQITITSQND